MKQIRSILTPGYPGVNNTFLGVILSLLELVNPSVNIYSPIKFI